MSRDLPLLTTTRRRRRRRRLLPSTATVTIILSLAWNGLNPQLIVNLPSSNKKFHIYCVCWIEETRVSLPPPFLCRLFLLNNCKNKSLSITCVINLTIIILFSELLPLSSKLKLFSQNLKIFYDFSRELVCKKFYTYILENKFFQNFYNFGVNWCFQ